MRLAHTIRDFLRRRRRLTIISWNVKVGRRGKAVRHAVREMIDEFGPDLFVLQEARPYIDDLLDVPGYTLYFPKGKSMEAGNCIALVRNDLTSDVVRRRALRMVENWHGPKAGKAHPGRVFLVLRFDGWRIVVVHRTRPGWSAGGRAFAEEGEALVESAEAAEAAGELWASIGDQNIGTRKGLDRALFHGPWRIAQRIGGRCIVTSRGRVDYASVGPRIKGKAKSLGNYGSDHSAVLIKLKEKRKS